MKNYSNNNGYTKTRYNQRNSSQFTSSQRLKRVNSMVDELLAMPEDSTFQPCSTDNYHYGNNASNYPRPRSPRKFTRDRDPVLDEILNEIHSLRDDNRALREDYRRLEAKVDHTLQIISKNSQEIDNLKATIAEQNKRIQELEKKNTTVSTTVTENSLNKETAFLFSGDLVQVPDQCSPKAMVKCIQDVCLKELDSSIPADSVATCRKFKNPQGKTSILLSFSNFSIRENILSKSIALKRNGLFVNEYLSKTNSKLLYELRQLKRRGAPISVFSRGGIPCYRRVADQPGQDDPGPVRRIFNEQDVEKLSDTFKNHLQESSAHNNNQELRRSERHKNN